MVSEYDISVKRFISTVLILTNILNILILLKLRIAKKTIWLIEFDYKSFIKCKIYSLYVVAAAQLLYKQKETNMSLAIHNCCWQR